MIFVVHISDIHFGNQAVVHGAAEVVAAMRGLVDRPEHVFLALAGDIAYSGQASEYLLAEQYFAVVRDLVATEFGCPCDIISCPGNHDCYFPPDSTARDIIVEKIQGDPKASATDSVRTICLSVQAEFRQWADRMEGPQLRELAWTHSFRTASGGTVEFRVLNSAWMSTLNEQQGKLHFPTSEVPALENSGLRITVMHHPHPWLNSTSGRALRGAIETTSDIILTGHEHDVDSYKVVRDATQATEYIEGGAFGARESVNSEFAVVTVDTGAGQYCTHGFSWQGDRYVESKNAEHWQKYTSALTGTPREHALAEDTLRYLLDPGLQLTHRAKTVTLEDLFVAPDLKTYAKSDRADLSSTGTIASEQTTAKILEDRRVLLFGENQSGKTALAKTLYLEAIRQGALPVMLTSGEHISADPKKLKRGIDAAVKEQYATLTPEQYWQAETDSRMAILDDVSDSNLNSTGLSQVAAWLSSRFGRVVVIGGELTQVEAMVAAPDASDGFAEFSRYEIRPFGYVLRDVLISKWVCLGRAHSASQEDLEHNVRSAAALIDSVLGDSLVPAYPMHILVILQQLEANRPLNTSLGSYGYFYEMILTSAFAANAGPMGDVDTNYTFLSELAWRMFELGVSELDEETLQRLAESHVIEYGLTVAPADLVSGIVRSRVLVCYFGTYRFIYQCFLHYFVARFIRDNSDDKKCKDAMSRAILELHREDHANVVIFSTYLMKDKDVIKEILAATRKLFEGIESCDLSTHVQFLDRLQQGVPEIVLPDVNAGEAKRARLRELDELKEKGSAKDRAPSRAEAEDLERLLTINRAMKTLQVLGQVLRNFSGSFKAELKAEIAGECIDLGLRMLNCFYGALDRHLDASVTALANLFDRDLEGVPDNRRVKAARELVFFVTEVMCFSTLRRISTAVGSEQLLRTYDDIERDNNNRATRFVQLMLRLDHCRRFPADRVKSLYKEVKNDVFGVTLLRLIVSEHLRYFPRPIRTRQSICSHIGIRFAPAATPPKRLAPGRSR